MNMNTLIDPLNDAQKTAVTSLAAHQLVLAGAGSGKTRVLVHRIAWLIKNQNISPYSILAVTFTNKAANEMRHRIENLLGYPAQAMWVGTFHGIAYRLLRKHWQEAGLVENFQILDSDDQARLIKRMIKHLKLDEANWPVKQAQWFINHHKDQGLRPQHIDDHRDFSTATLLSIYSEYQKTCEKTGLVDFAELLLRSHELWLQQPDLLAHYQQRLQYILVDEFQDTNKIQYAWIRMLAGGQGHIMIVGDDDQSIYGWRGANTANIQRFCKDYPDTEIVRLEQNYRSTNTILKAANAIISSNQQRMGKQLWTEGPKGHLIQLYQAFNEIDEARFIVHQIQELKPKVGKYQDIAILYRSNAQSRVLEEALIHAQVPYRIYGGLRFFERAEIKDALAYCRLCFHHDDDAAFERIINMPTRGIGERTLMMLRELAQQKNCSLWQACHLLIESGELSARANNAVQQFINLITGLAEENSARLLEEQVDSIIKQTGLLSHYRQEKGEKGQFRVDNLEELVNAAMQFRLNEGDNQGSMQTFLANAALEIGEQQSPEHEDYVQLMTLHSAKGLEFPIVFMCGLEQGLFPHYLCLDDQSQLEEERRLCYVGITRSMQMLFITYAERRRMYNRDQEHAPSCFINEIPQELIHPIRFTRQVQLPRYSRDQEFTRIRDPDSRFQIGHMVRHPMFGEGIITDFEGRGASARVQVKFDRQGIKWLVLSHAPLEHA